ncbi:MAG: exodeoxyribonuclease VII small subunit [Deltaproteobacteria bacterium]|nr:exodeoxyribonuclease VII small subunit [Deltaproteobacteria bacterium]
MGEKKFEKVLARLEEIVQKLEEGDMTLEDSLKAFEEGVKLSRFLAKKLDEAERKVEILLADGKGMTTEPFAGEAGDED